MNLRHAAALALIGWYLIAPPISPGKVRDDLPLSQWKRIGTESFRTKSGCEAKLAELYNPTIDQTMRSDPKVGAEGYEIFHRYMNDVQCISTDDPRLAK
ncbi:hypothetical protein [Candidatus Binatus sp.]|uniref:hypothetical protein n=1 Tax=Candidatus Binatus sp. TaxID=2811406 RepID=UPI003CABB9F0